MKTKNKIDKEFDTVKTFRAIKDKISKDIKEMTFEQFYPPCWSSNNKRALCWC